MLQTFLSNGKDPTPLLSTNLWGLEMWGMWQPKQNWRRFILNCIHISSLCFVISQLVELYLIRSDIELAMRNVSISMLSSTSMLKAGCFVFWQNDWKKLIEFILDLEKKQMEDNDKVTNKHLKKCQRYSRVLTHFYCSLVAATVLVVIFAPLVSYNVASRVQREMIKNGSAPYPEVMSSWLPFDRTRGYGYAASVVIHSWICFYGAGIVANFDSTAVVTMTFFATQLKILKYKCETLFDNEDLGYELEIGKIAECHNRHVQLVKHANILISLLSPVMFIYIIICSLMICASAVQMTMDGATITQMIWLAEYMLALIAQLFLYCWHSNEILMESNTVEEGVYMSAWWSRGVRTRKAVLLLGGTLRKTIVFTAGPFSTLSLATFVAILKGSYSYYTLISQNKN